jgi:hypothetical protein
MRLAPSTAAALAATVFAVAGCGGGGSGSHTSTSTGSGTTQTLTAITTAQISKPQFIQTADAVCTEENKATKTQIEQQVGSGKLSNAQLLQVGKIAASNIRDEVNKIRAIGAPTGDEAALNSILDAAESGAYQLESNPQQLQTKGEANADIAKADREATAYGFNVCGRS